MCRSRSLLLSLLAASLLAALTARAGEPFAIPTVPFPTPAVPQPCLPQAQPLPTLPTQPGMPGLPTTPGATSPQGTQPGQQAPTGEQAPTGQQPTPGDGSSAFGDAAQAAQAGEAGTASASSFNPTMFGDLIGIRRYRMVPVPQKQVGRQNGATVQAQPPLRTGSVPVVSFTANAFKITENESPRPTNRVFATFSFFNDVNGPINPPGFGTANLYRETLGFERTFLDGNASFGLRMPFVQDSGPNSIVENTFIGDLNLIFKYALYNDPSGDVFSTGLVVTLPTGPSFEIPGESDLHPTLFQPFLGYITNIGNTYLQGFSSLIVPTDMRDSILLFNDVAIGYRVYQSPNPDALVTAVMSQFEVHINTPLTHRGTSDDLTGFPDMVNLTGGVVLQLYGRATLGVAVGTPVTGPKPWAMEAMSYFNLYF